MLSQVEGQFKTDVDIIKLYFEAYTEEDLGDDSLIRAALGDIACICGMTWLTHL